MAVAQSSATDEEIPSSASGEVEAAPWSGWWWPSFEGVGPTLFAFNGPLDKYDRYVAATSGADPATRTWERQSLYFPATPWAGHCNGFAAAALVEPEPTEPVTMLGITFSVADLKMRERWGDFQRAYEDAINHCSTKHAPWHIVPANRKWFRDYVVASTAVKALEQLNLKWPKCKDDLSDVKIK